jgi:hypothetical protein
MMLPHNGEGGDQPAVNYQTLEQFNAALNEQPAANEIANNAAANNSKYIPISFIQMKLDKFFMGLWRVENFRSKVVVNEIIGEVTLSYYHPFAKVWINREGAASVMIMQKSGSDISDIGAKIKNTLQKDYPHLLASCISNAAKTIGKNFGRDLNRKMEDDYSAMYSDIAAASEALSQIDFEAIHTGEELLEAWKSRPDLHTNKEFIKKFNYRKKQLSK